MRGSGWGAFNGPANESPHRQALTLFQGKLLHPERFAIDWAKTGDDGENFSGDPKINGNHLAYGSEVLAVADATVVETKDGIPENVPGTSRAVRITTQTIGGNHVLLELSAGQYAYYAHLQPGSLRVKAGDRVRRGQVLGLVGNSGNSTAPHLHFQVMDRPSLLRSEGLPYAIDSYDVLNGKAWEERKEKLPGNWDRVRFP